MCISVFTYKTIHFDGINQYFELGHAELVPASGLPNPHKQMYYMALHAVRKESSTTTKLRVVLHASVKTATGASLNFI